MELPLNVFLLPLVGGYLFASWWNVTQWYSDRWEKERLLLNSATFGLLLFFLALAMIGAEDSFPCVNWLPCFPRWPVHIPPFNYLGVSLLACLLGFVLPHVLNLYFTKQTTNEKLITNEGTLFEILLDRAMRTSGTVMITLKSGKVYVGFPISLPAPGRAQPMIQILPTLSGYREADKHRVVFTTNYSKALDEIHSDCCGIEAEIADKRVQIASLESSPTSISKDAQQIKKHHQEIERLRDDVTNLEYDCNTLRSSINDFGILIPVDQIASMTLYHAAIHSKYFAHSEPETS